MGVQDYDKVYVKSIEETPNTKLDDEERLDLAENASFDAKKISPTRNQIKV